MRPNPRHRDLCRVIRGRLFVAGARNRAPGLSRGDLLSRRLKLHTNRSRTVDITEPDGEESSDHSSEFHYHLNGIRVRRDKDIFSHRPDPASLQAQGLGLGSSTLTLALSLALVLALPRTLEGWKLPKVSCLMFNQGIAP